MITEPLSVERTPDGQGGVVVVEDWGTHTATRHEPAIPTDPMLEVAELLDSAHTLDSQAAALDGEAELIAGPVSTTGPFSGTRPGANPESDRLDRIAAGFRCSARVARITADRLYPDVTR